MAAVTQDRSGLRTLPLLVAVLLSVGNLFAHKPISDVLDALYSRIGRKWYEIVAIVGIGLLSTAAAIPAARRFRWGLAVSWLPLSMLVLTIGTLAAQRWLLVTNIELIHFPQFALLAVLFLTAGFEPKVAWVLGSLGGLLDETYQHLVLYAGVANTYFDINDVLLNAIGAAWGVCLFGAKRLAEGGPMRISRRTRLQLGIACLVTIIVALVIDPPDTTALRPAMTRRLYRVLSIGEGLIGLFAVASLVELASWPRGRKRFENEADDSVRRHRDSAPTLVMADRPYERGGRRSISMLSLAALIVSLAGCLHPHCGESNFTPQAGAAGPCRHHRRRVHHHVLVRPTARLLRRCPSTRDRRRRLQPRRGELRRTGQSNSQQAGTEDRSPARAENADQGPADVGHRAAERRLAAASQQGHRHLRVTSGARGVLPHRRTKRTELRRHRRHASTDPAGATRGDRLCEPTPGLRLPRSGGLHRARRIVSLRNTSRHLELRSLPLPGQDRPPLPFSTTSASSARPHWLMASPSC